MHTQRHIDWVLKHLWLWVLVYITKLKWLISSVPLKNWLHFFSQLNHSELFTQSSLHYMSTFNSVSFVVWYTHLKCYHYAHQHSTIHILTSNHSHSDINNAAPEALGFRDTWATGYWNQTTNLLIRGQLHIATTNKPY